MAVLFRKIFTVYLLWYKYWQRTIAIEIDSLIQAPNSNPKDSISTPSKNPFTSIYVTSQTIEKT